MRIAIKYSMDDIQVAIARAIEFISPPPLGIGKAIGRLAFIAEFPGHISKGTTIQVFNEAGLIYFKPTAGDLKPLMAFPTVVALLMQYREEPSNPDRSTPQPTMLDRQFESLGFKPQT